VSGRIVNPSLAAYQVMPTLEIEVHFVNVAEPGRTERTASPARPAASAPSVAVLSCAHERAIWRRARAVVMVARRIA